MKEAARLIIPAWGEPYVNKVLSVTLPAVLAPGNLPALCDTFDVELVVVTETRLFDMFRASSVFHSAAKVCTARLVPLDDLLTDIAGDYGAVLTYALFRGFADLGARMTATYLLFLNADFIISDGSFRHLGRLMRDGKRVIHAPSFRVVLEDVWPQLQTRIDRNSWTLSLTSREMAALALAHKHPTVQARTVNQRLCHQSWMDQFYWYVDDDTLIGYQAPVALVAIKPERVVVEPMLVWDFAFIPEAAPTLEEYFIGDSDDFFMIEPQTRETGREMLRIGWVSIDRIAQDLSVWLTKEHRQSSKQLLKIHSDALPDMIDGVIQESRAYMAEVYRRMTPAPSPHIGHPQLGRWFEDAKERRRKTKEPALHQVKDQISAGSTTDAGTRSLPWSVTVLRALQATYLKAFGSPPEVGKFHPLWMELAPIADKLAEWKGIGNPNILWTKANDWSESALGEVQSSVLKGAPYDVCICEVALHQLIDLDELYAALRPLMKNGGHVLFRTARSGSIFAHTELFLDSCNLPHIDISEINFYGTPATTFLGYLYIRALRPASTRPLVRALTLCALFALTPFVRLINARAARRNSRTYSRTWTTIIIQFIVKRAPRWNAEAHHTISPRASATEPSN